MKTVKDLLDHYKRNLELSTKDLEAVRGQYDTLKELFPHIDSIPAHIEITARLETATVIYEGIVNHLTKLIKE